MTLKPGNLIVVTTTHKVPTKQTEHHTRIWKKGLWPYNHPDDLTIPAGTVGMVLSEPVEYTISTVCHVFICTPKLRLNAYLNAECIALWSI